MAFQYRPVELHLHITRGCQIACDFCYERSGPRYLQLGERAELTLAELLAATDGFKTLNNPYGDLVVITGGEPTTKFSTVIDYLRAAREKYGSRMDVNLATNAGLLGATGEHRDALSPLLAQAGLAGMDARAAAKALAANGLSGIQISYDATHTTMHGAKNKVPFDAVQNTIAAFLEEGYGSMERPILLFVTSHAGDTKTEDLLEHLITTNHFAQEGGRLQTGSQYVEIRRNAVAGMGNCYKSPALVNIGEAPNPGALETLFNFQCRARSKPLTGEAFTTTYWQDGMSIDWDGTLYSCVSNSFAVGNIREDPIPEIVRRLKENEDHPKYGGAIKTLNIMQDLSAVRTWDNRCLGECLRLIYDARLDLLAGLSDDRSACYRLGHEPEMQRILIERFSQQRDALLAKIHSIDQATEDWMRREQEAENTRLQEAWAQRRAQRAS